MEWRTVKKELLVLWLVCCVAGFEAKDSELLKKNERRVPGSLTEMIGPGFLYTRDPGRCTPQYWSSRREAWPNSLPQDSSVSKVFGSILLERYEPELTLLDVIQRNDDIGGSIFIKLVKQASTALLNSYTRPDYPYNPWEVKALLVEAIISEKDAASQAEAFSKANHGCS
ncbi:uncharacterized protein LOC110027720 [Phalaenopsis equestris]|uniref:uncharacterized protein LOC110027720 n=1 Tax=Phalaenopsis equestris TaxID=78828 RepID=UPI0009E64E9A|nr:uncharacterized protein LOC110027720 [Phalaenopsis equestris]